MNIDFKKVLKKRKSSFYADDFLIRIRSSVIGEGMLSEGNLELMDYAIRKMPKNGKVLEIGSWGGLSSCVMLHLLKKHNRKEDFLSCDPWIYESMNDGFDEKIKTIDGASDVTKSDFMDYIMNAYKNAIYLFHNDRKPNSFRLTSDDFFKAYEKNETLEGIFGLPYTLGGDLSFCYIDGDHSYDGAKKDFINVDKYLKPNGFVLFDDSDIKSKFGSAKLMQEVLSLNGRYKLIKKNPNHLFMKIS